LLGGDRPDEAGEFARAGDDDLLLGLAAAGHSLPTSSASEARTETGTCCEPGHLVVAKIEWDADPETFDLVSAATAWHWIDPAIRYRKAPAP